MILDSKNDIHWMKKDSWLDKGKFFNWHESKDYAATKNIRKIGGFEDWRLPTGDEAMSLHDETLENPGKGGVVLHIDPLFPEGAFKTGWVMGDTSTRRPRWDFSEGKMVFTDEYTFGSVRLCRKSPVEKDRSRVRRNR